MWQGMLREVIWTKPEPCPDRTTCEEHCHTKRGPEDEPEPICECYWYEERKPNGTSTSVSRANLEAVAKSWFRFHRNTISMILSIDIDRIIQMDWEDRTSFDVIRSQFGLTPGEVIAVMRRELKPSSFRLWRARRSGRKTKHVALRGFEVGRFRCPS